MRVVQNSGAANDHGGYAQQMRVTVVTELRVYLKEIPCDPIQIHNFHTGFLWPGMASHSKNHQVISITIGLKKKAKKILPDSVNFDPDSVPNQNIKSPATNQGPWAVIPP